MGRACGRRWARVLARQLGWSARLDAWRGRGQPGRNGDREVPSTYPPVDGRAGCARPCRRTRRQVPDVVGRGLWPSRSRGLRSRERRHDLQRPVDVEAVHGDRGHAGRGGRPPGPRRADHDLPAGVHSPQRVREAPRTEDHASHAPQPHRRRRAGGAGGKQLQPRPRQLRRARAQHLRHLVALPGGQWLCLLESGDRPRRLHPAARRGEAVCAGHARLPARTAGHGPQRLRPRRDPRDYRPRPRARAPIPAPAGGRADDRGRRPLHERRRSGRLPPLRVERRLDRRPGRARPKVAPRDADRAAAASRRTGGVRARRRPTPLEPLGSGTGSLRARRWRVRVPLRSLVGAPAGDRGRRPDQLRRPSTPERPGAVDPDRRRQ